MLPDDDISLPKHKHHWRNNNYSIPKRTEKQKKRAAKVIKTVNIYSKKKQLGYIHHTQRALLFPYSAEALSEHPLRRNSKDQYETEDGLPSDVNYHVSRGTKLVTSTAYKLKERKAELERLKPTFDKMRSRIEWLKNNKK